MKNQNKKIIKSAFAALLIGFAAIFTGCADVNGLHNQQSVNVTIVFTNFPTDVTGEYSIPGSFDGDTAWEKENDECDIVMKNGEGTSNAIKCTSEWIQFTLVKVDDWTRGWFPTVKGNAADGSKYCNFYSAIDLSSSEITVTVDGSSGTASITAE